jgi:hypothetical protein
MEATVETKHVVALPDGRVDPENAALYCGLTPKTLAIKRSNGTGPKYVKVGRVFYFLSDLDAWLAENRVGSTAQNRLKTAADQQHPVE